MQKNMEFAGNAKEINGQYGSFFKIGFKQEDIAKMQNKLAESEWVNLVLKKSKNEKWYIAFDEYKKPEQAQQPKEDIDLAGAGNYDNKPIPGEEEMY